MISVALACGSICLLPGVVHAALVGAQRVQKIAVMSLQTRRDTLRMGMAALTAGTSSPAQSLAGLRMPAPTDAELIRLCGLWRAVDRELDGVCDTRATVEMEHLTQADFDRMLHNLSSIENEISKNLPPKTGEGAAVIARLALYAVNKSHGDSHGVHDVCTRMAWDALAFFVLYGEDRNF